MSELTVVFCTFNRCDRLPRLVAALRAQRCAVPFDILAVDNNSEDGTEQELARLAEASGGQLRYVKERRQGIVYARNRAIEECLNSDYMLFLDDDELPWDGFVAAGYHALAAEGADCVGGRVRVNFSPYERPKWLGDELLGFLAEVDYGADAFWITDRSTPVWTANIGYRMELFRSDPDLRFDARYNRKGMQIGGGEDAIMFRELLKRGYKIRYRPDMGVDHFVEEWRLRRRYFLKLHFRHGTRFGQYETQVYSHSLLGVPPFMLHLAGKHWLKALAMLLKRERGVLRQAMSGAHELGCIWGRIQRWKDGLHGA